MNPLGETPPAAAQPIPNGSTVDTVVTVPVFNEEHRIDSLLERIRSAAPVGVRFLFVDDASTDQTSARIQASGHWVIRHETRLGCGPAVRTGMFAGLQSDASFLAVMAGNGKDDPRQLDRILALLRCGEADFVQGSRYQPGGSHANMPLHRRVGTRLYSLAFSALCGQSISDATNGFRALRRGIIEDSRVDLTQPWLRDYEVESYLFFQAIALGYRVREVPVSKLYPATGSYTKMKPFVGWWSHFRPALLLALRLKR